MIKKLLFLLLFSLTTMAQTNLVPNNGFEIWTTNTKLSNWTIENSVTQNTSTYIEGSKSAQLSITNSTTPPKITAQVPMTAGTTYTVKFKYKYINSNYSGQHPISLNISKNGSATTLSSSTFASNNNWTIKETTFTPDQNLAYDLSISIFTFDAAAFNVLIDDVQVYIKGTEQYTLIPDVKFENKLIALGIDSGSADGKVLTNSVKNVTSLDVSYSSIADLKGIQDFAALTTLNCYSNNLTAIDITKNTALKTLNLSENKITNINLSANINLEKALFVRNPLNKIDVSANVNLEELSFPTGGFTDGKEGPGAITSLDVSNNPKLKILDCSHHKITNLDFSANPLLQKLTCGGTNVTNLDLSKNTALTFLNIDNSLLFDKIDLSANVNLIDLSISSTNLLKIDLSKNTALKFFNCRFAPNLQEINLQNGANNLINSNFLFLNSTPTLTCILVDNVTYSETNWKNNKESWTNYSLVCETPKYTLIPDIEFEKTLIAMRIDFKLDGKVLTARIANEKNLDLRYASKITDLTGIEDFTILETLTTPGTKLGKLNVSKNIALKTLNCSNENLISLDVTNNVNLNILNCSFNKLNSLNVSNNTKLNELDFGYNLITDIDVSANTALTKIAGAQNKLTNLNLSNNPNLDFINCGTNNLTTIDFSANTALTSIYCYENQLTSLDLTKNSALKILTATKASFTSLDLSKNQALTSLTLTNNALLSELNLRNGKNSLLTTLNLTNNSSLVCINVDDSAFSNANWGTKKDAWATYSLTCSTPQYTLIPDVEFEKALISFNYDTTLDGKILTARAAQIKDLNISSYPQITDLTGIEDFTALESLKTYIYSKFKLKTLNLTKNTALKTLELYNTDLVSLDLSKNIALTDLIVIQNNALNSINLQNKNNTAIKIPNLNLSKNISLYCVLVDNVNFSNVNWSTNKNEWVNYSVVCTDPKYTLIPDIEFEKALISDGLDYIEDGKVLTARIATEKTLNLRYSNYSKIKDLTGIEDYAALETLITPATKLEKLNISKNIALKTLDCSSENLTSLDVSNNKNLVLLDVSINKITSINVSENIALEKLNVSYNNINNLDLQNNTNLITLSIGNNSLKSLDITKNSKLTFLNSSYTLLESLNLSANTKLSSLYCNNAKLVTLDVSKNSLLINLRCNNNLLKSLNLKNENNTLFSTDLNFKSNPGLSCIQVDDVTYSNANWLNRKDALATFNTECIGELKLPPNNFTITSKSETCLNSNNGEINIKGTANFAYKALINGKSYSFVNNSLTIPNLTPGVYTVSITITGEVFEQNFTITIPKGATITGKSSLVANKVAIDITEGTAPYTVFVNGTPQFETNEASFILDIAQNGLLEVKTAKVCEGIYAKKITGIVAVTNVSAYPNPTLGSFEIALPTSRKEVVIELYDLSSKLISKGTYTNENGKAKLSLEQQTAGVYIAKVYLDTPEYLKIIKK